MSFSIKRPTTRPRRHHRLRLAGIPNQATKANGIWDGQKQAEHARRVCTANERYLCARIPHGLGGTPSMLT
jgi:hypothetical protein